MEQIVQNMYEISKNKAGVRFALFAEMKKNGD